MNKVEVITPDQITGLEQAPPPKLRRPPTAAKFVLPVWGYSYVRHFLECGLPTLLAPGNLPGVVAALPTEFIIQTSIDDETYIREHPAFKRLADVCPTQIRLIDHLVTDRNYSTTITLAYAEAVRDAGDAMVDTCFFFLVADYIMADGSLTNALKRMQRGVSAIVVGNFQVAREDALPWLQDKLAVSKYVLTLPPRMLMRWALNHLHPATLANTVNIPFSHNWHTNRLFWRVDGSTILGRFYLMHMLCVRPETTEFIIGASCDYSFVPEMCPSGNVEAIIDSDEYLVVELQPIDHESAFLRPGPLAPRALAKSLNRWTTAVHRQNARFAVVFHAGELPKQLEAVNAEADAFLDNVGSHLRHEPMPHRGHPYWRGAMAAFYDATGRKLNEDEWRYALGLPANDNWITQWLVYQAKFILMGRPPRVLPWHPAFPDFKAVLNELAPFFANRKLRLLMLSNEPTAFSLSLADSGERVHRMRCTPFLQTSPDRFAPLRAKFDMCLLELPEADLRYGGQLIDRIVPLMRNGGQIIVSVTNRRLLMNEHKFGQNIAFHSARLITSGLLPTEVLYVPTNIMRRLVRHGMFNLRILMSKGLWFGAPLAVAGGGLLFCLSLIGNLDSLRPTRRAGTRGNKSSFLMRLTVDKPEIAEDLVDSHGVETSEKKKPSEIIEKTNKTLFNEARATTGEPLHHRGIGLKNVGGLASPGLTTNQAWYDDPRQLAMLLARYKFVAKMLSGIPNAAEVGCGDVFGSRIVLQQIPELTVYDFDQLSVGDIRERQEKLHDVVMRPLPRKHDALFSLNVLEHLDLADEHAFLANLCESLSENGLLIIGSSSVESQPWASQPNGPGQINRKSGKQLKALLEKYFAHVFIFSMTDDVVQAGFSSTANYFFALCAKSKWEARDKPIWEGGDVTGGRRDKSPTFQICELKENRMFYVLITEVDYEPRRVGNFTSVAEAALWIREQALDWVRIDRPTSY
jgi:hypothetical protein